MSWIKLDVATVDKPEVFGIALRLQISENAALGACLRVWAWADANSVNGKIKAQPELVDAIGHQPGLADAMCAVGWLRVTRDGIVLPHFGRHNGETAKRRALGAARSAAYRSRNAESVMKASLERTLMSRFERDQIREEKKRKEGSTSELGGTAVYFTPANYGASSAPAARVRGKNKTQSKSKGNGKARVPFVKDWFESEAGTDEMGRKLGLVPSPQESYPDYRNRIRAEIRRRHDG